MGLILTESILSLADGLPVRVDQLCRVDAGG